MKRKKKLSQETRITTKKNAPNADEENNDQRRKFTAAGPYIIAEESGRIP